MLTLLRYTQFVVLILAGGCWPLTTTFADEDLIDRVVSGKVVDSAGIPVPNAAVYCSAYVHDRFPTVTGRSGPDGVFSITIPPVDEFTSDPDRLWVFAQGYCVTVCSLPKTKEGMASLHLTLRPESDFQVKVTLPNGKPAQDAVVLVSALGLNTERFSVLQGEVFSPPEVLLKRTAVVTDHQGVARITAWRHQEVLKVSIQALGLGRQTCHSRWLAAHQPSIWNVTLMPAGKLRGHVVADGDYPTQGLPVNIRATSTADSVLDFNDSRSDPAFLETVVKVITDSQGYFEVPKMMQGWLDIEFPGGLNKPYQYTEDKLIDWCEADPKELVIRLRKAVRVRGACELLDSDASLLQFRIGCVRANPPLEIPVRGPDGELNWPDFSRSKAPSKPSHANIEFYVDIDNKGRFEFYSPPGDIIISLDDRKKPELDHFPYWTSSFPIGFEENQAGMANTFRHVDQFWKRIDSRKDVALSSAIRSVFTIPNDVEDFECPSIHCRKVHGRVVNSKGEPVPKVLIVGVGGQESLDTDKQGKFHLWLDPTRNYSVTFNPNKLEPIRHPDGVYEAVQVPGRLPEYNVKVLECSGRDFPDGLIPDVVLPYRAGK